MDLSDERCEMILVLVHKVEMVEHVQRMPALSSFSFREAPPVGVLFLFCLPW